MSNDTRYKYLNIPLYFLQLRNEKNKLPMSEIIGWAIINFAKNIDCKEQAVMEQTIYCYHRKRNDISDNICYQIDNAVEDKIIELDEDFNGFSGSEFNPEYELETFEPFFNDNNDFKNECIANYQFNIALKNSGLIADFQRCFEQYNDLNSKLNKYEGSNGKDIYVSVVSSYLIDAMKNIIPENTIRFIVAIKSIIQRRNYSLGYKTVILRRMFGCKTDEIFINYKLQNKTVIPAIEKINKRYHFDRLMRYNYERGFFTFISAGRGYYISTKYKIDKLKNEIMKNRNKYDFEKSKLASKEIRLFNKEKHSTTTTPLQHLNDTTTAPINDTLYN